MKRIALLVVAVSAAAVALVAPGAASAHPLGNFTVNHFAAVDLAGDAVFVRYALDLAEIPTFQEGAAVRRARLCGRARAEARARRRRPARPAHGRLAPDLGAAGRRGAAHAPLRRGLPRRGRRAPG